MLLMCAFACILDHIIRRYLPLLSPSLPSGSSPCPPMRFFLGLVALACATALAAPSSHNTDVLHERRALEPNEDWELTGRVEGTRVLPLRIGLTQSNLHELESLLMDVSHPESPLYGQHWSAKQVGDHFAPSDEAIEAVSAWLSDAGFDGERMRLSHSKGWVEVNATVSEVEELLQTEYNVYTHTSGVEQIGVYLSFLIYIVLSSYN